ncbi:hypothetical protein C0J52_27992 [Blattella germanica]|nr:hypothetical protein C0J52_27992 [Blattella germanica]
MMIPKLTIEGNYTLNGRVLVLPIQGKGDAHFEPGSGGGNCKFGENVNETDHYGSDMIFKILLMPRNYRTKKPPLTYTDENVLRTMTDVQNKTATFQQAQEKYGVPKSETEKCTNDGEGTWENVTVSDESEESGIDSVRLEMDLMPEVQYEKPDWSNILHGKFALVGFIGAQRKKTHYKYVCCVQYV